MRETRNTPRSATLLVVTVSCWLGAGLAAGPAGAYTLVTRDGHRIEAQAKPEIKGLQVILRLAPHGRLAMIQEQAIDWARTEAANPAPDAIALPADMSLSEKDQGAERPREVKIMGGAVRTQGQSAPDAAPQASPDKPSGVYAQEAVIALQKEHARLAGLRSIAVEKRTALQTMVQELEGRELSPVNDQNPTQRKLAELRSSIAELDAEIGKYDSRLNDISAELVQLGGSVD